MHEYVFNIQIFDLIIEIQCTVYFICKQTLYNTISYEMCDVIIQYRRFDLICRKWYSNLFEEKSACETAAINTVI